MGKWDANDVVIQNVKTRNDSVMRYVPLITFVATCKYTKIPLPMMPSRAEQSFDVMVLNQQRSSLSMFWCLKSVYEQNKQSQCNGQQWK